jgi:hypothetical protein
MSARIALSIDQEGGETCRIQVIYVRSPVRLLGENDHIRQLDRCLTDDSMPLDLRVVGALVLLFGMLASRPDAAD